MEHRVLVQIVRGIGARVIQKCAIAIRVIVISGDASALHPGSDLLGQVVAVTFWCAAVMRMTFVRESFEVMAYDWPLMQGGPLGT